MKPLTKDQIHELALKYTKVSEFRQNHYREYKRAISKNWWNDVSSHLQRRERVNRTFEDVMKISYQYDRLMDFIKNQPKYYIYAKRRNWLQDVTKHMLQNHKWNLEDYDKVLEEARKYKLRSHFQENAPAYYYAARKYGWLSSVCEHMKYHAERKPKWLTQ